MWSTKMTAILYQPQCVNSYKASEYPIEYAHVTGVVLYYLGEIWYPGVCIHHKSLTYNLK